ncbi:response regulator [Pseudanabaena sp. FACHB-2040]|uniref:response regulator n=1 Tax=Pseudanabaena sp. FACHB-2040 TaxID=2692859 RepID=UPI001687BFB6|nr:response regulator [Pseudanabaena sp. FACHB-2040]MBD2256111.1 response regulator [Pseudanabaena sp. FACHB-2040]
MLSDFTVNVLLVDDHPENLAALEAMLERPGQNLVKARSGEEALRCLLNQDFAVILLDVQMPGIDGFETATLIRQRERSCHTPIIFLTAFSTGETSAFTGYALGAVDYLLKPINPAVLTSKVAVFVDLFKKTMEVQRQAAQLTLINDELRRSEERFRSLSACSPIGIFLTDTNGRCTYTNPSCQAICGFRLEDNWKLGWSMFMHPEDRDRVLPDWLDFMHKGWAYSTEFRICTPDRDVRWVQVRTSPMLSDNGQLLGQVGTIEDISERKQAEAIHEQMIREQAARQQAEAANRMKDEFLMLVSHELRTPLNATLGWSRLLLTRELDEETITRALETINRNACSQAKLIEDLLDVSKLMQGKLRLAICPVSLTTLLGFVLETIRPLVDAKSIHVETQLDAAMGKVLGDPERLQQVMLNLLSNAIKFTPEGGRVTVGLSAVSDGAVRDKGFAELTVTDTGIGIPADFLPHVFDRFRQADSTTTRVYGGLGLGLAIAYHLVELHGGKICADSQGEGQGSTFTVRLPLALTPNSLQPAEAGPCAPQTDLPGVLPSLAHTQVLLVEDHDDNRDFIATVLEGAGAQVMAAASVKEALQCLEQSIPDVLISDISLPDADGYGLIGQVKVLEAERQVSIPAIALSAHSRQEDRLQALAAGFLLYITKPVEPDTLVAVVAQVSGATAPEKGSVLPL